MQHKVAVTVKDKQIKEINVLKNGKRKWAKMAEGVIPRVLEAQNTTVDAVTGATTSSKALLMSIYNA